MKYVSLPRSFSCLMKINFYLIVLLLYLIHLMSTLLIFLRNQFMFTMTFRSFSQHCSYILICSALCNIGNKWRLWFGLNSGLVCFFMCLWHFFHALKLFVHVTETLCFLSDWKKSIIRPVYRNGPRKFSKYYRPVGISPKLSVAFERFFFIFFMKMFSKKLSTSVWFSEKRSTVLQLLVFMDDFIIHMTKI